ncbi:hypothetical protein [Leptospira wolffii]|uniref:HD domain-containing protein n=1 Tax=Leptospira wolffii TaxID=409998 RepID=UPI000316CF75|nr:hypothetical protein [Leptospira wolffii]EPG64240.1 hypothetical protein LEP1GSC061_3479 [Leptospira wolffii serovar Khorat str. Khorat-H2]
MILRDTFFEVLREFSPKVDRTAELWKEIETRYSEPQRYYHTLEHLFHFLRRLSEFRDRIADWPSTILAMYYHDIVYDPRDSKNEENSSILAEERILSLGIGSEKIEYCKNLILQTKGHNAASDFDTKVFLDCDLSILGADRESYGKYALQIRQEYIMYPDEVYFPGRKKVLEHFLSMDFIFKTQEYKDKNEKQARENLTWELGNLEAKNT